MPNHPRTFAQGVVLLTLLGALSCSDGRPATPPPTSWAQIHCLIDVAAGDMRCASEGQILDDRAFMGSELGDRLRDFTLRGSDAVYTPRDSTLRARVSVRADGASGPIGTPDGDTVSGIKVFMEEGPYIALLRTSADSSDRWVRNPVVDVGRSDVALVNPDGFASFTGPSQPYMEYLEILAPGQWSAQKEWRFRVPPEVSLVGFRARVFASVQCEKQVPPIAPDSVPPGFYDRSNVLRDSPYFGLSDRILKGIVTIRFEESATRDERQAAVDLVRGSVVGGYRVNRMEGYYFVRVSDDGTGAGIRAAVDTLNELPTVATAQPEYLWIPAELKSWSRWKMRRTTVPEP